jgi:predicted transposase YbfD/YdcC
VPDYLPEITRWPGIKSIARIEAIREVHGKKSTEIRYLIGSTVPDARAILSATRLHWGIENGLHRCLDVAFREDASAIHLRQAAANLGVVRKLALNLFRLDAESKLSLPRKRKQAAWKPDYLFDLLSMQPVAEF